ncbi:hypothetical protein ANN_01116 [Periplaneta americana]|uniref:Uncharacterized protein n=1 Tax=Periplaneta americana TaxID=6978 RepID=A0ABQ8TSQ8_PERAM|nr:hypothetical protein ANN_01116 [Periplaneta americana]
MYRKLMPEYSGRVGNGAREGRRRDAELELRWTLWRGTGPGERRLRDDAEQREQGKHLETDCCGGQMLRDAEHSRRSRLQYLRKIKKYREEGRSIFYMDDDDDDDDNDDEGRGGGGKAEQSIGYHETKKKKQRFDED